MPFFYVNKQAHHQTIRHIDNPVEYGGCMKIRGHELVLDRFHTTHNYSKVPIPAGVVQFHTHPNKCSKKLKRCALSIPSSADLTGFANSYASGDAEYHLVYTTDGVYNITMNPFIAKYMRHPHYGAQFTKSLIDMITTTLAVEIINIKNVYKRTNCIDVDRWIAILHNIGFNVTLTPLHILPKCFFHK